MDLLKQWPIIAKVNNTSIYLNVNLCGFLINTFSVFLFNKKYARETQNIELMTFIFNLLMTSICI